MVGISLKDLKKEDKPNLKNIFGLLIPSKIDSHHEGNVSLVQSSVSTWLFANSHVETDDWTKETLPSWWESIFEGVRRPKIFFKLGLSSFFKSFREIPTILLMNWAFGNGLMQFGVFRCRG